MLEPKEEVEMLRMIKAILKEYDCTMSEKDMAAIANGTFDYREFVEKFPLPLKITTHLKKTGKSL